MKCADSIAFMDSIRVACLAPRPTQKPSEWCTENLIFDEAGNHGPFKLTGCEYIREPLDDFADAGIADEVLVWGSQTRKTGTLMGGASWAIANDPCGFLWVMPSLTLVQKFSRQRFQKLLQASGPLQSLIPRGAARHDFSTASMMLGASTLNFVGSNSPANLASNPCRRVILDEVDKFDAGGREEADAVNLAEQRTKDQTNPQRWKTSTPTLITGIIWQEYLKGDQRRYFVPCPHCNQFVVFAWSQQFTVLPKTGSEAYVFWDKEAKRKDGSWDLERVMQTARIRCPHCSKGIEDSYKTKMVRNGQWRKTNLSAPAEFISRHLPSLYACSPQTSFGSLAVKFLQAKNSLMGLQGFINGELAEPYLTQDKQGERTELITANLVLNGDWKKLMTVDCQARSPYFWYVVRAWLNGNSEGIEAGSCDTWEEVRDKQLEHGIADVCVCVDSGYGARSDADVYKNCSRFGTFEKTDSGLALAVGWLPSKGMAGTKKWKDNDTGLLVPYLLKGIDPFVGLSEAGSVEMSLLEFAADFFKDILQALREGKGGYSWKVAATMATEDYWKHMDGETKTAVFNKITGRTLHIWKRRSPYWPNHLLDCEVIQIALANFFGLFSFEEELTPKET